MTPPISNPGSAPVPLGGEETLSPLRFVALILKHRVLMIRSGILTVVAVALWLMIPHRAYSTAASFMPQPRRVSASNVAGLAAQFGLSLPTSDPASSPAFYVSLLQSHEILGGMVDSGYTFNEDAAPSSEHWRRCTRSPARARPVVGKIRSSTCGRTSSPPPILSPAFSQSACGRNTPNSR
jgi:uncharacterized protein involved in exopolysaccharide biosynthesis